MKGKIANALCQIAGGIFGLVLLGVLGLGLAEFAGCKPLPDHTPPPMSKAEERYEAALDRFYHAKEGAFLYSEQASRAIERGDIEEAKNLQTKMSDMLIEMNAAVSGIDDEAAQWIPAKDPQPVKAADANAKRKFIRSGKVGDAEYKIYEKID